VNLLFSLGKNVKFPKVREISIPHFMPPTMVDKRRLIKDPVWGNLEIFNWESRLLNHFLFNRLHNIVQNSSAYKVYPGLKYSRFLHSLGVSHVASQLFLNVAANANGVARIALTKEAEHISQALSPESRKLIVKSIVRSFPCNPTDAIMLAAIRVASLIHDIGHLPYSHVFENAVDGFRRGELGDAIKLTASGHEGRNRLNDLIAPHEKADGSEAKLHEFLGSMFAEVLEIEFREVPELSGLLRAALAILKTDNFPIAKGIIVGTIDADRIDFVRRDGFFSGLFNSSVDFSRMFAFYELALTVDEQTQAKIWKPRPSPRTTSETEKLLLERFLDYKYIVVHHRVHLYDEIMENILVRLMANGELKNFVDTLCTILAFTPKGRGRLHAQVKRIEFLQSLLTKFDDPWVEVEIRHQYDKLKPKDDATTSLLFEAYVEDRHCFRSAFKTDTDFQSACADHAPGLLSENPTSIRNAFGATKYVLQNELSKKLGRTVLIGATDKKLSFGIRDDYVARFINVPDLYHYLVQKKIHSLTFNFWYEDQDDSEVEHGKIVAEALKYLEWKVTKQLQLVIPQNVAKKTNKA
jgi:HD superfamily phosphohydrolase